VETKEMRLNYRRGVERESFLQNQRAKILYGIRIMTNLYEQIIWGTA